VCSGCGFDAMLCERESLLTNVTCVPGLTVRVFGLTPLEVIVIVVTCAGAMVAETSVDATLVPQAFFARTRMKYVPDASVPVVADVAVFPVSVEAMFDAPELVPISTTYDVGDPAAAFHEMKIDEPFTVAARPVGADGDVQGAVMVNVTSFDAVPVPHAFFALTRAKYVPGPSVADSDVCELPVSVDEIFAAPELVPSSTMYDVGEPDAAPHVSVTVELLTDAVKFCGAPGDVHGPGGGGGGAGVFETVTVISVDAALDPMLFAARTRTK